MADLVLNASAACALCFEDEESPADPELLLGALREGQAWVPALFLWEVANVLLMAEKRGRLSPADRVEFLQLLESLQLRIDRPDASVVWHDVINLAGRTGLTSYDAAYLELAMRLGLPIASGDGALRKAAGQVGVEVLGG
jgi:predicted nucleic acid-binding protein